jgi:hypothetical protein
MKWEANSISSNRIRRLVNQETYCPAVPVPGPCLTSGCREGSGGFCRSCGTISGEMGELLSLPRQRKTLSSYSF